MIVRFPEASIVPPTTNAPATAYVQAIAATAPVPASSAPAAVAITATASEIAIVATAVPAAPHAAAAAPTCSLVDLAAYAASQNPCSALHVGHKSEASPVKVPESIQSATEYVQDIVKLLFHEETHYLPKFNFMDGQVDINPKMRAILIDWLVEVHLKYHLRMETLYLTVNIIDRFLGQVPVPRKQLQLIGVVAMLIASKFEEVRPPQIKDFIYITDNAYSKKDVVEMECTMLGTLAFRVVVPTAGHFLETLLTASKSEQVQREIAFYLVELSLLDHRMVRHAASMLAAAALLLSNELSGLKPVWPSVLVRHSHYPESVLRIVAGELRTLLNAAPSASLQAVRKKYSQNTRLSVAKMPSLIAEAS